MTCGFLVRLGGLLGQAFGVCANEYSPSDGHVVTIDHGCGAHSEGGAALTPMAAAGPVLDSSGTTSCPSTVTSRRSRVEDDSDEAVAEVDASEPEDVSDEADVLDVETSPTSTTSSTSTTRST